MPWPPGQVTPPPPTPRTHCQQNTLPPPDKKVFAAHPPLRIISGTALKQFHGLFENLGCVANFVTVDQVVVEELLHHRLCVSPFSRLLHVCISTSSAQGSWIASIKKEESVFPNVSFILRSSTNSELPVTWRRMSFLCMEVPSLKSPPPPRWKHCV